MGLAIFCCPQSSPTGGPGSETGEIVNGDHKTIVTVTDTDGTIISQAIVTVQGTNYKQNTNGDGQVFITNTDYSEKNINPNKKNTIIVEKSGFERIEIHDVSFSRPAIQLKMKKDPWSEVINSEFTVKVVDKGKIPIDQATVTINNVDRKTNSEGILVIPYTELQDSGMQIENRQQITVRKINFGPQDPYVNFLKIDKSITITLYKSE